ncbi:MAG: uracil-DNA glycosylase [Bacillota bacterium]|nr:uracil-DNA glycosylase [Bacillota bacterium]
MSSDLTNEPSPQMLDRNWSEFVSACSACTRCGLAASRLNVVVWRGAVVAPLLIVGEDPGASEDEQGLPFVGRSGELLDTALTAHGLDPSTYHICNIVKCRPPGNRQPTPEEAEACRPWLRRQLQYAGSRVVLLLGATALRYFTGETQGITKVRGQWRESRGFWIMPSFHPAYLLRDRRQREPFWQDLTAVRAKLEELGELPPLPTGETPDAARF